MTAGAFSHSDPKCTGCESASGKTIGASLLLKVVGMCTAILKALAANCQHEWMLPLNRFVLDFGTPGERLLKGRIDAGHSRCGCGHHRRWFRDWTRVGGGTGFSRRATRI